ncbi:MAG TPA: hypothetical protein VHA78_05495 [Candidatus Peribacteraceae bacterium]|nr:hypothetical protein [Candidatus Peribacteraceae bacterium]
MLGSFAYIIRRHAMRKVMLALWLELYALFLAVLQIFNGVRTDEAKYLLNIPYPHPPLARAILSSIDGWSYQEFFWRIVFATLLVQSVWLLLRLVHDLRPAARIVVAMCWLLGCAMVYQAGTIMMAPLTALEGLVFLYLLLRDDERHDNAGWIALFWILSLFTAYQAVLFAPAVWVLLRRSKSSAPLQMLLFFIPLALLALYTFSNPLALASMTLQAHKNADDTVVMRILDSLRVWALGGSVVLSIVGTYGILRSRSFGLIGSFVLVALYVLLARYDYYAILFTPLFLAGVIVVLRRRFLPMLPIGVFTVIATIVQLALYPPVSPPSTASFVMQELSVAHASGALLINGSFGHEWEYAGTLEVKRYEPQLLQTAGAVVCLAVCPPVFDQYWTQVGSMPDVFVRK